LDEKATGIRTIYNQTRVHDVWLWMKRIYRGEKRTEPKEVVVLDRIDLVFKPGRMYLVLGDPGRGGKEALLKAIAGKLEESKDRVCEGSILYNEVDLRVSCAF
jgi:ABC-type multidrug transport system ATPase subunit